MTTKQDFFVNPDTRLAINRALTEVEAIEKQISGNDFFQGLANQVSIFLRILTGEANAAAFDDACQYSIQNGKEAFLGALKPRSGNEFGDWLERLAIHLYRLSLEFDLTYSPADELPSELSSFNEFMKATVENFLPQYANQIKKLEERISLLVAKFVLNDPDLKNFRNLRQYSAEIESKFTDWEKILTNSTQKVDVLQKNLSRHEQELNFVGLADGFKSLLKKKNSQLKILRGLIAFFGILVLAPIGFEFHHITSNNINIISQWPMLAATTIPAISLVLIFLYFFRIVMRNSDSTRSQILQLELRLTLCQFVESYTKFAIEARKTNNELLNKFDAIIFSSIVGSDEKIPPTFEGAEQLMNLVKNLAPSK
ncbi:hypothetical protein [Variovorax sp. IB41]|uniref:hypothetical protein n=1 Tax=Variovorax sp. IB41 TaxID=2779370 RepID=UPI0018E8E690|nr:hypothetical protein [Variovorax sp. IB41]MBJ2156659.1 hypothetical protein [Variovorax sp. IB41]